MFSKIKKYIFYAIGIYALLGFVILPYFLKPQIIKIVEQQTNSKLSCESIYFNPFVFTFSLNDVVLHNLQNQKLVSFKKFGVDLELYSLFRGVIHLKSITLQEPKVFVELSKEKQINLLSILKPSPTSSTQETKTEAKSALPHIMIDKIKLSDGYVSYKIFHSNRSLIFLLAV